MLFATFFPALRGSSALSEEDTRSDTLAQAHPLDFVCYTLLFFMVFIATSKVFSPQYLLWLAPFVALIPLRGATRRLYLRMFVITCLLSTFIFPFLFWDHVSGRVSPEPPWSFRGPTLLGATVLGLRNLIFLGLFLGLSVHVVRRYRLAWAACSPAEVTMASARRTLANQ
jgi:hypothetical protein